MTFKIPASLTTVRNFGNSRNNPPNRRHINPTKFPDALPIYQLLLLLFFSY